MKFLKSTGLIVCLFGTHILLPNLAEAGVHFCAAILSSHLADWQPIQKSLVATNPVTGVTAKIVPAGVELTSKTGKTKLVKYQNRNIPNIFRDVHGTRTGPIDLRFISPSELILIYRSGAQVIELGENTFNMRFASTEYQGERNVFTVFNPSNKTLLALTFIGRSGLIELREFSIESFSQNETFQVKAIIENVDDRLRYNPGDFLSDPKELKVIIYDLAEAVRSFQIDPTDNTSINLYLAGQDRVVRIDASKGSMGYTDDKNEGGRMRQAIGQWNAGVSAWVNFWFRP